MRARVSILALVIALTSCKSAERVALEEACAGLGRIVRVGDAELPSCEGASFVRPDARLARALEGSAEPELAEALRAMGARALFVKLGSARGDSLAARLARAEPVEGLRALTLAERSALLVRHEIPELSERESWALAEVARRVLAGTTPPTVDQLPSVFRAPGPVEVMVLLRQGTSPLIWRSARGNSIGASLLLALGVARGRWAQRAEALGGTLEDKLPTLDVEVWLLFEDGTYLTRSRGLVERTLVEGYGPGYEDVGTSWHYVLPERLGEARGMRAFERLFDENTLDMHAFEREDLRLYRVRAARIAVSKATPRRIGGPPPVDIDPGF